MQHTESTWIAADGTRLYEQAWTPDGEVKGVVCLVHGLGEHSGRYGHVAEAMTAAGYAILAFDLRGHGKSGGQRGHAASLEAVMDDIGHLLERAAQVYPGKPCFLYGHSLGGLFAIYYALQRKPALAGVIATSPNPFRDVPAPAWKLTLGKILYNVYPTFSMTNGLDTTKLSCDSAVAERYRNDPLVHDRVSVRYGIDFIRAGEWTFAHASEWQLPLLIVQGTADRIASPEATKEFANRALGDVTLRLLDNCYHETHNEPNKTKTIAANIHWMDAHLSLTAAERQLDRPMA